MNTADIIQYLPVIIPLAIAEITLALIALVHVLKHPDYKFGNKIIWILVVLVIQFIGPVVYFAFGRGDE